MHARPKVPIDLMSMIVDCLSASCLSLFSNTICTIRQYDQYVLFKGQKRVPIPSKDHRDAVELWKERMGLQDIGYESIMRAFVSYGYAQNMVHGVLTEKKRYSNKNLAFEGDAILNAAVAGYLSHMNSHLHMDSDTLVKIAHHIESNATLNVVARELNISSLLMLSDKALSKEGIKFEADAVEALIGVIYERGGLQRAFEFVLQHVLPHAIHSDSGGMAPDPIRHMDEVEKHIIEQYGTTPTYRINRVCDNAWRVGLYVGDELLLTGDGKSIPDATVNTMSRAYHKIKLSVSLAEDVATGDEDDGESELLEDYSLSAEAEDATMKNITSEPLSASKRIGSKKAQKKRKKEMSKKSRTAASKSKSKSSSRKQKQEKQQYSQQQIVDKYMRRLFAHGD